MSSASSPYLLEHADNPVNWYEWGEEAMMEARKENKPLLISIGYASCHWCHVMEKESFMDTGVARIMNENFICIKVDREERPDIDNIYMDALQLLSGNGGWPLNAFALPDGKPFFAGTYYTRAGWKNLLNEISIAFAQKNSLVVKQAEALTKGVAELSFSFGKSDSSSAVLTSNDSKNIYDSIYDKIDLVNGGLKGAPKFPMPAVPAYLLQHFYLTRNNESLGAALLTLDKMALGGIYDHVGGGFARYATDTLWRVPHFEKMLYDNGQLISLYANAYKATQNSFYKNVFEETIAFLERDLRSAKGGFYSSLNADTDDGEGQFYSWKEDEFNKITGKDELVASYFNISVKGNWKEGSNILSADHTPRDFAVLKGQSPASFISSLNDAKSKLLAERSKRIRPTADTKILTSWNAIMLRGYVDAYAATSNDKFLNGAVSIADFIEKNMMGKDGSLKRNFKDGKITIDAFLDDYGWSALAFIKLFQVTFNKHWLDLAKQITDHAIEKFYNAEIGMFYYAAMDTKLAVRKVEVADNAIPSSNAIMANVLYMLGVMFDDGNYSEIATGMLTSVASKMNLFPVYYSQWCSVADLKVHGTNEIVIMGKDAISRNMELQRKFLPASIIMGETDKEILPLMEGMLLENKTLIYVCVNRVCKKPVENVPEALKQLN